MSLHLTARHRARLAATRRLREIETELAELFAQYPELRADPKRPGVVKDDSTDTCPHQAQSRTADLDTVDLRPPDGTGPVKKYSVF